MDHPFDCSRDQPKVLNPLHVAVIAGALVERSVAIEEGGWLR
jgi:hypothetical protein